MKIHLIYIKNKFTMNGGDDVVLFDESRIYGCLIKILSYKIMGIIL